MALNRTKKKTYQGNGKHTKYPSKGSAAAAGGKTPKKYRKKYRGQGKR
jgi:hypothetical protein